MTTFAYYRVSTDKQDYESQKVGVVEYAKRAGLTIDKEYLDDGVSGTVLASKRKLGKLLSVMQEGDTIITSELSRLGRSTADVINTCTKIAEKGVNCYMVKQGMSIDKTPMGKLMISIFAAFSEMERDLISQRTKEGLARVKASGKKLGRAFGTKNKTTKMDLYADKLPRMIEMGLSSYQMAKALKVGASTVMSYLNQHPELNYVKKKRLAGSTERKWAGYQKSKNYAKTLLNAKDTARTVKKYLRGVSNTTMNTENNENNIAMSGI